MATYLCRRHNRKVQLTAMIADSGEAKVWHTDFQGFLAKIYHNPHNERIQKLQLMVMQVPQDPNAHQNHVSFAWPYSVLEDENTGEAVGFLMPEVKGGQELLAVCTYKLRKRLKLPVNWFFLHVVARNVAGIIQAIHQEGYVLGDIKLQNILVNDRALPTIIDTDSFQVRDEVNGRTYHCLVGSEGFTPPELIGVDLAQIDQTEVHDRFRLGVAIYYLLFGCSPFTGAWQGSGAQPEQVEWIRRGLWAFGQDSLVLPSPATIPLDVVHPTLKALFLRCFNDGHLNPYRRPTPQDWLEGFALASNDLVPCDKVDTHYYSHQYGKCYWCTRHQTLGLDIFPGQDREEPPPECTAAVAQPTSTKPKSAQEIQYPQLQSSTPPVRSTPSPLTRTLASVISYWVQVLLHGIAVNRLPLAPWNKLEDRVSI